VRSLRPKEAPQLGNGYGAGRRISSCSPAAPRRTAFEQFGGRALADWLLSKFGRERAAWAMLFAALLVGLPIFFEVGFIILVPLVWNLARESKRSLLFYGLPMAAALTVTHALVPPHPAPAAAAQLLGADLGRV
jgi:H+/gluconate symporter-like permease